MNAKDAGLAKGDRVLVTIHNGRGERTAQPGVVRELAGRGAFVRLDGSGKQNFFFSNLIIKDNTPKPAPAAPQPIAKQPSPPHFAPKTTPEPSIGKLLAAERECRGITQGVAARELGIKLAELQDFESGVDFPSDELVLTFSEAFSVDLAPLSAALERQKPKAAPKPAAEAPVPTLPEKSEPAPAPAAAPTSIAATPEAPAARGAVELVGAVRPVAFDPLPAGTFEDFVERLDALTPLPAQKLSRQKWFLLARELFKLSTETA